MKDLTVKEIKEELTALGIEFDRKLKKDELLKLLEQETVTSIEDDKEEQKEYVVIWDWKDLEDGDFIYIKGDPYPRKENKEVSQERIQELMSSENKIGKPLIKERD